MSDYFDRIETRLVRSVEAGVPRRKPDLRRPGYLALAAGAAIVVIVVAVALSLRSSPGAQTGTGQTTIVYWAMPTPKVPVVTQAALARSVRILDGRLRAYGVHGGTVSQSQGEIILHLPTDQATWPIRSQISGTGQLSFYDWEADALLPDGKTVASQLPAQNQQADMVSQGAGEPNAGSMSLYAAVKLASEQPYARGGSAPIDWYYAFAKGGSAACAAAAKFYGVAPAARGQHCLVEGPATSPTNLGLGLPQSFTSALSGSDTELLVVKPGTVVLQAVPPSFANPPNPDAPTTQFYVLKDNAALTGSALTKPRQSTDTGGNPDVQFGFTSKGAKQFTAVTAAVAKRGSRVSSAGSMLEQHFAVALDDLLVTVPSIDYKAYPFGVPPGQGAEITGGFTVTSARRLATELRLGALPLKLELLSIR